jgi:hydrogenase-4 component J
MGERIVFYQLRHKFVNQRQDVPENARQVVYYTLAIGHHVGVLDCFSSQFEVEGAEFRHWLNGLPEGKGRTKLEGVIKWGEIEINREHVDILLPLITGNSNHQPAWCMQLSECLQGIIHEPALYLMVRKSM